MNSEVLVEKLFELNGHSAAIYSLDFFSDDSNFIYTASGDGFIARWDISRQAQNTFYTKTAADNLYFNKTYINTQFNTLSSHIFINYYNKSTVDSQIKNINDNLILNYYDNSYINLTLANYSTTTQMNTILSNYVTTSNYYDKLYVDSISGNLYTNYYIKSEVDYKIQDVYSELNTNYYGRNQSDIRYYTKTEITTNYYTKTQSDTNYYTKAQSDTNYYTKTQSDTNYYTKTQSDTNYYNKTYINTLSSQINSNTSSITVGDILLNSIRYNYTALPTRFNYNLGFIHTYTSAVTTVAINTFTNSAAFNLPIGLYICDAYALFTPGSSAIHTLKLGVNTSSGA